MHLCNSSAALILLICSTAFATERMVIDSFEYTQNSAAQDVWKPQGESLPVEVTQREDGNAMLMRCDFSRKAERCLWDREVNLDLTDFGRFSFWLYAENTQAFRNGTIYFQSEGGWFAGEVPIEREGWKKVSLWKGDFRIEGSPSGWNKIGKIRLSFWKASNMDAVVAVDNLEAAADDVAIVLADLTMRKGTSEARAVNDFYRTMAKMLADSGVEFSVLNDTDVESDALSGCKLALFPYNPDISEKECIAIESFVKSGGRIMLFYCLPERIAKLIGVQITGRAQEKYSGQFSSISLDAKTVEGLPEAIFQGSWNVRLPKPIDSETKVIGQWVDAKGKAQELPAITFHPCGVFMGHVLMPHDTLNKQQMLLALFGELNPDMREYLSKSALQSVGRSTGFEGVGEASQFIENNVAKCPETRQTEILDRLAESKRLLAQAEQLSGDKRYGAAIDTARKAAEKLREAFFRSLPARDGEFRAVWAHSAFGIPGWDWDKAIKWLKENGFNAIVTNMLRAGTAFYPSEVLPVSPEIEKAGDQIAKCLEACRKYGVELHVWKVNWYLSMGSREFIEQMRKEGRLQKDKLNNDVDWLCPSQQKNYDLELESMLEIVRKYDVDGIHFDYIRYPDENSCYCSNCKEQFEKSKGVKVESWPVEVVDGKYKKDFVQWRCDQITRLVGAVSEQARKINPKIKISAAVFNNYPACREAVGQDWKAWIDSGYLDFVCPMNYTANNDQFRNWVNNHNGIVSRRIPLYPGIGASAPGLPPEQAAMQAFIARELGVDGFIIFNYDLSVATNILPALSRGLTSPCGNEE